MKLRFAIAFALAVFLGGCGGNSDTSIGVGASSSLTFTPGASYNGNSGEFKGGIATTTAVDGHTVVTLTQGARTLALTLPANPLPTGETFSIGLSGTLAVYTEVTTKDTQVSTWAALGGKITIGSKTSGSTANLQLDNLKFQTASGVDGNFADGSFTLNGKVNGVPAVASVGTGGTVALAFSDPVDTNANTSALANPTITLTDVSGFDTLLVQSGSGASWRLFVVTLTAGATEGTTIELGHDLTLASMEYDQGDFSPHHVWVCTGGNLKVLTRNATTVKVQLIDAKFVTNEAAGTTATGSFVVNGTISHG